MILTKFRHCPYNKDDIYITDVGEQTYGLCLCVGRRTKKMKKMYRIMIALFTVMLVGVLQPIHAEAATWQKDTNGWWWQRDNGSYPSGSWEKINGTWYYFDASGYMTTGWQKVGGTWYYMDASGAMLTGWQKIGGTWYYMDASGAMLTGWQKISGTWYYMDADGAMLTGWQWIGGTCYYLDASGAMAADTWIDGYYVDASGVWIETAEMSAQWMSSGGRWWYRHADGSYTTNDWECVNGQWYYFDSEGWMAANQWIGDCYADANGNITPQPQTYTVDLGNGNTTTVVGIYDQEYSQQVVALVNQYRAANGLNTLTAADFNADIRGYEIAYSFGHTRPNGSSCFTVMPSIGGAGENIAAGYGTPDAVMTGWKNSPGHNENLLNASWTKIDVACFRVLKNDNESYGIYWVQLFGQ